MAIESLISAILNNPDLQKAAITGLANSFARVLGESGLKQLGKGTGKLLDGSGKLTAWAQELVWPIARKYIENYEGRHGNFKVLGMPEPVSLDGIYTRVSFDPENLADYDTLDRQQERFRDRQFREHACRDGMEIANDRQYLMVLGGPGVGKSTFLRKVGLEALKQGKGEYKHLCIPVFLELRKYRWETEANIDLEAKIAEEFQNCGLPDDRECTQKLLKDGKLLLLFDGLDEVPSDTLPKMTAAIKNLVDRYSKNRYIASCRIAAYRSFQNFSRFTEAAIADFDREQIECFIDNWFKSHSQLEWGKKCWQELNKEEHKSTLELAQTPLLLTLICILFRKKGNFPSNKATLYENAISVLLEEWDATKEIVRQQLYKDLDTKAKSIMLAEIAYNNFVEDNLFFQKREIAREIEEVLKEIITDEKSIDGRNVLRSIEEQHGILVGRFDDMYSFSHLTIQEFLTAQYISDNKIDLQEIVDKYLSDRRWREVFLLLAGLESNANNLLLAMERKTQRYINTPKLQNLLAWVDEVVDPTPGDIQPLGKRALAIANANAYANAIAYANAYANAYAYANAIKEFIKYGRWVEKYRVYQIDLSGAIDRLETLKSQIPDNDDREASEQFAIQLINWWLEVFRLTPDMVNLSPEEIQLLNDYLYCTWLSIECQRSAVRKTPQVWQGIEERMLRNCS